MKEEQIKKDYLNWLYSFVYDKRYFKGRTYKKLFECLYNIDFTYTLPMDDNRAVDGIDLRYRFGNEKGVEQGIICRYLDNRPCSVLEMMAALSRRCEEHIMADDDIGNRTGKWFWGMLENLKVEFMDDLNYDENYICEAVSRFLERRYSPNGEGGLFTVRNCGCDLRNVEIWYQMCLYLRTAA